MSKEKATPFATDFKTIDMNADGKVQSKEWMDGCSKGLITNAAAQPPATPGGKTSDRSPEGASDRAPGATNTGAAGTDTGKTTGGTSDRTPTK